MKVLADFCADVFTFLHSRKFACNFGGRTVSLRTWPCLLCVRHVPNWPFRVPDQGRELLRLANAGTMPPRRIAMPREAFAPDSHSTVKDQVVDLYKDFEHEVKLEANNPIESPQGDLPVRKHVT